jgi:Putative lumazine-binding
MNALTKHTVSIATITDVIDRYFWGIYSGDVAMLRSTFHAKAELFGEVKGAPYHRDLVTYLDAVANRKSPQSLGENFAMQVLSIEQRGPVARATVSCPMLGNNYVDFLNLVRSEGKWVITNKTFTHVEPQLEKASA